QVEQQAGLYIRTNGRDERLRSQNVLQGTHDWMKYEATIPVAQDALFIRFGLVLHGKGQIWLANARLDVIELVCIIFHEDRVCATFSGAKNCDSSRTCSSPSNCSVSLPRATSPSKK